MVYSMAKGIDAETLTAIFILVRDQDEYLPLFEGEEGEDEEEIDDQLDLEI